MVKEQKREWGKGFACAGRSKTNTNVVSNFKGQIPGTEVGQMWLMRIQLCENGIHRPPVAGIHANEKEFQHISCNLLKSSFKSFLN